MSPLLTAALVAVLAVASAAGRPLLAAGVVVVQLVFALGGVRLSAVPAAAAAGWLAAVVGVSGSVWTALDDTTAMRPVAALLGPALVAAVVVQLGRRDGRPGLTVSLTMTVAACTLAALPVAWVALRAADGGAYAVALGLLGVGVVSVAEGLRGSPAVRRGLAVLVAGALAAGLVLLVGDVAAEVPAVGALVVAVFGALIAVTALAAVDRMAGEAGGGAAAALDPLRVTLPIVAAAPVSYVLGRILVG
ncbi:MAG: hypothetical protein ACRDWI_07400 [Jiangellaceae bacterium]